jgi:hypothetical protein
MRIGLLASLAATALVCATAAQANVVTGVFTATVTSGTDYTGVLGLAPGTDLTGLKVTGSFSYDSAQLPADIAGPGQDYALYYGTPVGVTTITETIAGHTFVFNAVTAQYLYLQNDGAGHSGFELETVNYPNFTYSHSALIGVSTTSGQFAVNPADPGHVVINVNGPDETLSGCCAAQIYENSGATWALWRYGSLDTLSVGVPEPAAWSLMLLGFAGIGAALRRKRDLVAA